MPAWLHLLLQTDFPPGDFILNFNVLTIATKLPEDDGYAVEFIEAVGNVEAVEAGELRHSRSGALNTLFWALSASAEKGGTSNSAATKVMQRITRSTRTQWKYHSCSQMVWPPLRLCRKRWKHHQSCTEVMLRIPGSTQEDA